MTPMLFSMVPPCHLYTMRRDRLFCLLVFACTFSLPVVTAQPGPRRVIIGDFQRVEVDNLGNVYVLTRNLQLRKYGPGGDSIGVFNDVVRYGKISAIDVSNPLRVMLFYRNFGTILLLDRMLRTVDVIDLRKRSMLQVSAVSASYDNQCWIYDEQESRLRKIDPAGRMLLETPELRMIMDLPPSPVSISDEQGVVSIYDPERGLYRFDLYGAFQQRIPLIGWADLKVIGKFVEGWKEDKIMRYELLTGITRTSAVPFPLKGIRQIVFHPAGLYALDQLGVLWYDHRAVSAQ